MFTWCSCGSSFLKAAGFFLPIPHLQFLLLKPHWFSILWILINSIFKHETMFKKLKRQVKAIKCSKAKYHFLAKIYRFLKISYRLINSIFIFFKHLYLCQSFLIVCLPDVPADLPSLKPQDFFCHQLTKSKLKYSINK
jgi:hypothetical protein